MNEKMTGETIAAGSMNPSVDTAALLELLRQREANGEAKDVHKGNEPEDFRAEAVDVLSTIDRFKEKKGIRGALDTAWVAYVNEEIDPEKANFAAMLIAARVEASAQDKVDELDKRGNKTAEESGWIRERVDRFAKYSNRIKTAITDSGLGHDEFQSLLERASGGNEKWAAGVLRGVSGEIAVYKLADSIPGVEVRWGTPEEDVRDKTDIVLYLSHDRTVKADVKVGGQRQSDFQLTRPGHCEIGIAYNDLEGFDLKPASAAALRYRLERGMDVNRR